MVKEQKYGYKNGKSGLKLIIYSLGFFLSLLVQASLSKTREFIADAMAVDLITDKKHLISALIKISKECHVNITGSKNFSQMCTLDPSAENKLGLWDSLLTTQPSLNSRIEAIEAL